MALWYVTSGRSEYRLPEPVVVHPCSAPSPGASAPGRACGGSGRSAGGPARPGRPRSVPPRTGRAENGPASPRHSGPGGVQRHRLGHGAHRRRRGLPRHPRGPRARRDPGALWTLDGRADGAPGAACDGDRQGLPYERHLFHVNADMMETVQSRSPARFTAGPAPDRLLVLGAVALPPRPRRGLPSRRRGVGPHPLLPGVLPGGLPGRGALGAPCVVPTEAVPADRAALGHRCPASSSSSSPSTPLSVPERKNPAGLLAAFARVVRGRAGGRSACCSRSTTPRPSRTTSRTLRRRGRGAAGHPADRHAAAATPSTA